MYLGICNRVFRRTATSRIVAAPFSVKKIVAIQVGSLLLMMQNMSSCIKPETRKHENMAMQRGHSGGLKADTAAVVVFPAHARIKVGVWLEFWMQISTPPIAGDQAVTQRKTRSKLPMHTTSSINSTASTLGSQKGDSQQSSLICSRSTSGTTHSPLNCSIKGGSLPLCSFVNAFADWTSVEFRPGS